MTARPFLTLSIVSLAALGGAIAASGCSTDLCNYVACVEGTGGAGGMTSSSTSTATGTTGTTTGASMTSSSTGVMPGCELTEGMAIEATCGVFVKAGPTNGDGSQASPFNTISAAVAAHPNQAISIYVCGTDTFDEAVNLGASSLRGGLTCADWKFSATNGRPTIEGPPDLIAVTSIAMAGQSRVIDSMIIHSPAAVSPGASSIGLLVFEGDMLIARSKITAEAGAKGKKGTDGGAQGPASMGGLPGKNACGAIIPTPPGSTIIQSCNGMAGASLGGSGGNGDIGNGSDGSPGSAGGLGQKGIGEPGSGSWSCSGGGNGTGGADGSPGMVGLSGTDKGTLSVSGFTPLPGGDGDPGVNGQGGGGGGGAKGLIDCDPVAMGNQTGPGASGGSGGAGGCGGLPGGGGVGGGSSFAVVALQAALSFSGMTSLASGPGGIGGDGGIAQPGASGGTGASGGMGVAGSKNACRGGDGGQGGNGGGGGGGRGGHSASVVYVGTAPNPLGATFGQAPSDAAGGIGHGNPNGGNNGMSGVSCKILDFAGETCAM
ncbi:MAG: hypothetical protein U0414_11245 [Polyangiaceae bacterium]